MRVPDRRGVDDRRRSADAARPRGTKTYKHGAARSSCGRWIRGATRSAPRAPPRPMPRERFWRLGTYAVAQFTAHRQAPAGTGRKQSAVSCPADSLIGPSPSAPHSVPACCRPYRQPPRPSRAQIAQPAPSPSHHSTRSWTTPHVPTRGLVDVACGCSGRLGRRATWSCSRPSWVTRTRGRV